VCARVETKKPQLYSRVCLGGKNLKVGGLGHCRARFMSCALMPCPLLVMLLFMLVVMLFLVLHPRRTWVLAG